MQATAETVLTLPAAPAGPSAAAALGSLAGGSVVVLLLLYAAALAGDLAGLSVPGLVAALDPARSGSLPELCGIAWLTAAGIASLGTALRAGDGRLFGLGLLPMVLVTLEVFDLAARLEPQAGALLGAASGTPAAKLAADLEASGVVLVAAAISAAYGGAVGRRCLLVLLLLGGASLGCDLAGRLAPLPLVWILEQTEETLELIMYTAIAAGVLAATLQEQESVVA